MWARVGARDVRGRHRRAARGRRRVPINPKAGERELGHIVEDTAPETILLRARRRAARRRWRSGRASTSTSPRAAATSRPSPTRRRRRSSSTPRAPPARPRAPSCRAARSPRTSTRSPTRGSGRPTTSSPTGCRSSTSTASSSASSGRSAAAARRITSGASPRRASPPRSSRARRWSSACRRCTTAWPPTPSSDAAIAAALRPGAPARVGLGGAAGRRARAHRAPQRPAHRRALRDERDAHEHLDPRRRRAPRRATSGRRCDGVEIRLLDDDGRADRRRRRRDDRRDRGARARTSSSSTSTAPTPPPRRVRDGWFRTGDLATRAPDGYIRIVGRRATDLIKSGGFKIGAGEIEGALLEHPGVREAAVTGEPDPDLGERIVAWIVPSDGRRAVDRRAGRPRRLAADAAQAPAGGAPARRAAAQRDGQGPEAAPQRVSGCGAALEVAPGASARARRADRRFRGGDAPRPRAPPPARPSSRARDLDVDLSARRPRSALTSRAARWPSTASGARSSCRRRRA